MMHRSVEVTKKRGALYDTDNTLPVDASNLKEGYKVVKSGEDMSVCHKKRRVLSRRV